MVESMSPRQRARLLRALIYRGGEPDDRLLREIAVLALDGNDDDPSIARFAGVILSGRRVKVGTYPTKIIELDGYNADLVYEIESAFMEKDRGETQ
jgi:hypothetical protein